MGMGVHGVLCTMLDDAWTQGSGRVGSGSEFGVCTDMASASRLLCQLVFHVQDLVVGGGHVVVLGKFGLVRSQAIFARPETRQSSPRQKFWDRDRDHQGPSRLVWSRSRPSADGPWES